MLSIVMGIIAMCLGIWGVIKYWWYIVEILTAIVPLLLIFGGLIAVLAGIKNTGLTAIVKEGSRGKEEPFSGNTRQDQ